MRLLLWTVLVLHAPVAFADEVGAWVPFVCPPSNSVNANGQAKFAYDLPSGWTPVLPPAQTEKWMATELTSSSLALLEGTLRVTCSYVTGGEMIAKVERVIPNAEAKFSECIRENAKRCAIKGRRKHQSAENACLVDVKLHEPRPDTQVFLPFGVMTCPNPSANEKGCHFRCRS